MTMKQFSTKVRAAIDNGEFEEMTPAERSQIMHQALDLIEAQNAQILKHCADLDRLRRIMDAASSAPEGQGASAKQH